MPQRVMPPSGARLGEMLERHGLSSFQFSRLAGVSHSTVVYLLQDKRTAGHRTRDKLAAALRTLGEPREAVEQVFPPIVAGRTLQLRRVPGPLFRLVKQAGEATGLPHRDVVLKPYVDAYPVTPVEVARAVKADAERQGKTLADVVRAAVPGAPALDPAPADGQTVPVTLSGVPDEWYRAWKVGLARLNLSAVDALAMAFDLSLPYPPGVVVAAARQIARGRRMSLARWVSRVLEA